MDLKDIETDNSIDKDPVKSVNVRRQKINGASPEDECPSKTTNEPKLHETEKTKPFKPKIQWLNAVGLLFLHLAALYGFYLFFAFKIKLQTMIFVITVMFYNGLSITMGAHRLWSHRSFKAKLPLKLALLLGQTMAGQNCLWVWVRDHRTHHKYTDTDADPHNSRRGLFFSHVGWLMMKKHPDVMAKGKNVDMSDLNADPWVMFQKNHYMKLYFIFAVITPILIPWYFWNEELYKCIFVCYIGRYVFQLNGTWAVNSYAHFYGSKPYNKNIYPAENDYVSFISLGEGWHNYHHTFPWDCQASEYGKHLNLTSTVLNLLARWGQAYDLKMATKEMMVNRIVKNGDGTHPYY